MVAWKRVLLSRRTWVCFVSLVVISFLAAYQGTAEYSNERHIVEKLLKDYPDSIDLVSPSYYWLGMSDAFFSSFYFFIFPLLVSVPLVGVIYEEQTTGNLAYQLVRMSRLRYYCTKIIVTLVCAFLLCLIPMILNIVFVNGLVGQWDMSSFSSAYSRLVHGTGQFGDSTSLSRRKELFSALLERSPYLYILLYYLINAAYAAAYAFFGLAVSFYLRNRYLIIMSPLILYLGVWVALSLLQLLKWDPFDFLDPRQPVAHMSYTPFVVDFVILLAVSVVAYILGVRRHQDVLG